MDGKNKEIYLGKLGLRKMDEYYINSTLRFEKNSEVLESKEDKEVAFKIIDILNGISIFRATRILNICIRLIKHSKVDI